MLGAEYQTRRSLGKQRTPRVLLGNLPDVEPQGYRATTDSCNLKRRLWVVYRHAGRCWDKSYQRRPPAFDLKWSMMWHVVAVALLCFLGGATICIYEAAEEALQANRSVGAAVGKHLEMRLLFRQLIPDVQIPDVQRRLGEATDIAAHVMRPGQCVQYVDT